MADARRVAALLVATIVVAGCGDDDAQSPRLDMRLLVEVHPRGPKVDAYIRTTIECHYDERLSVRCQRLDALAADAFVRPPGRRLVHSDLLRASHGQAPQPCSRWPVSLRNGCEIARWERFAWLLGDPPGIVPR